MPLLIRHGQAVLEDSVELCDIYIDDGKIQAIQPHIDRSGLPEDTRIIEAEGAYIFPGFIDAHTHYQIGEYEGSTADDFFSGSVAAAHGGITTFIDFSDQLPDRTLLEGAEYRMKEASDSVIDYTLHQGIYHMHEYISEEIHNLRERGIRTVKLFSTYKEFGCYLPPETWNELFPICGKEKMLITLHAEDDRCIEIIQHEYDQIDLPLTSGYHAQLRPAIAEYKAIYQAGTAALQASCPLYIVHVSSSLGLHAIRELRSSGASLYAETTPHYLMLDESLLWGEQGNLYMMTPPLRTSDDNNALVDGIEKGEIGIVATDHCSFSKKQKLAHADCRDIPAGVPGSEELASLIYSRLVTTHTVSIVDMKNLLSAEPARVFGMYPQKGSLQVGTDADIVIFSAEEPHTITASKMHSACDYTPYEGFTITGSPVITISHGNVIVDHGEFTGQRGAGSFIPCGVSSLYQK